MPIKLVEFSDGTFGIRRGWFHYRFMDFKNNKYWWPQYNEYFFNCKTDKETAMKHMVSHKVVKM
jgi:hypothetical protein